MCIRDRLEDGGKVRNYSLFPDNENRRFAVYYLELEEGSYWESEPHLRGTTEFITIFTGKIEILADGQSFIVEKGESIRFRADKMCIRDRPVACGTRSATTSVSMAVIPSSFSAARPLCGSDTIMRSMPYSEVSARLSATILTPASETVSYTHLILTSAWIRNSNLFA